MLSSSLWSKLPNELIELIFSQLVDAHIYTDPAYTWVCLRQLSAHQKHTIELRFRSFWLSKISITLYAGTRHKFEYVIDDVTGAANPDEGGRVIFSVGRQIHSPIFGLNQDSRPGRMTNRYLREAWDLYDPAANRNITVRLGEGYLARGCKGGYLLNDTHLPRLQVSRAGKIRFLWKEAVNELLREEMYMRQAGDDLVCAPAFSLDANVADPLPPVHRRLQRMAGPKPRRAASSCGWGRPPPAPCLDPGEAVEVARASRPPRCCSETPRGQVADRRLGAALVTQLRRPLGEAT